MVQNYKKTIFSKTKKKYVFFILSDKIWPIARQQIQEQAPVEQVGPGLCQWKLVIPVAEQAPVEPVSDLFLFDSLRPINNLSDDDDDELEFNDASTLLGH